MTGNCRGLFNVTVGTEENHEVPQSVWPISRHKFQNETFQFRSRIVNNYTAMFGTFNYTHTI
jgi:hypothetical protein